ncbi:MAG: FAD-dependent oxidoreductase [Sphingobacteriales bacterium]|nr:FAD-dependent oxidoreductase [Sphingobacteriales bacterium]
MPEYKHPASEQDFEQNFASIKPLMNATEAYYESSRCLFCYDAPCIKACPTEIDIPLFIRQINGNNPLGAAQTIYQSNHFGHACGKVCPTEVLCEGACVYNHQNVKPIEIGRLQSFATQKAINSNKKMFGLKPNNGKKVAIIGAGPAGISCACELRMNGFDVTIYEAKAQPSGLTVYGVAPYKITNQEVLEEMAYLQNQFGFTILYNHPIATKQDLQNLEQQFDSIFLGIGLGETSQIGILGEDLDNCFGAVEFIEQLRMEHHQVQVPQNVVVLGGGNTAMDAASECARMGSENVILAYRREKEAMGAYDFEYELAKTAGVKGLFNAQPIEIVGENGCAIGVKFVQTTTQNGQLKTIENSEFVVPCNWVIKATGQSKRVQFLQMIDGLELDSKKRIVINPNTYQTTNPRYFAAGDAVNGGKEVVNAVAEGRKAANAIVNCNL